MKLKFIVSRAMAWFALMGSLFVLHSGPAHGQSLVRCNENGALLAQCAAIWERVVIDGKKTEDALTAWATGSFQSFVDGVAAATVDDEWCPNDTYASELLSAVSAKYIREHPEKWREPALDLVLVPLAEAFPCGINVERSDI
jgi:Rap1a immunity proteins